MRPYRARYSPEVSAIIRTLHPTVKAAVRSGIDELIKAPLAGHELQFELSGFRSFRVTRYRIIYRINEEESRLEIHYVGPRLGIYESFRDLLSR